MTEESIGGFRLERFAEFVVEHAEEFPQCLTLLKEAFRALSTAEHKIELLKQCFIEHYEKNRKKSSRSSVASSEDCDGNSTIAPTPSVTEYRTESEEGEPTRKKKKKKATSLGGGSDNTASHQFNSEQSNIGSGHSSPIPISKKKKKTVHEPTGELGVQSTSTIPESFPTVESEELKIEMDDDKKIELILNTVTGERDPLAQGGVLLGRESSEAPTEASVSSTASSVWRYIRDGESSECVIPSSSRPLGLNGTEVPSLSEHEGTTETMSCKSEPVPYHHDSIDPSAFNRTASPALRVIPSAFLMENPEELDAQHVKTPLEAQPLETHITPHSSGLQADALESGDCNTKMEPTVLYFEFDRAVDNKKKLAVSNLIKAVKNDETLCGRWISVDDMKRVGDLITGHLVFPDVQSSFRAYKNGIQVNGFHATLIPVNAGGYYEPFGFEGPSTAVRRLTRTSRPSKPALTDTRKSPRRPCESRGRGVARRGRHPFTR